MYAETTVIYSDVLFLINFSLDYLCLFIAGRILNRFSKVWRIVAAAAFGGLYSFLPYAFVTETYISLPLHILSAFVICMIAFGYKSHKQAIFLTLTFIVTSALFGGLISGIFSLSDQYSDGTYTEMSAASFCVICVMSAIIVFSYSLICGKRIHTRSARIRITLGKEKSELNLLCDSGNLVTEPFSALPVIIVSAACLPYPYDMPESEVFPLPIRIIPFTTSAGGSCFFGFRPSKIELLGIAKKPKSIDAFIGIDTQNKSYSGYDGLIPTSIL